MVHIVISHVDWSRFSLLNGLSDACLNQLMPMVSRVRHKAHTNLLFPGDKVENVYLVESGWVKLYRLNEAGQESIVSVRGPGESLLLTMLFYNHPSPLGVKTETEASLLQIPVAYVKKMLREYSDLAAKVVEDVSNVSHHLMYLVEQVTVQSAVQRVGGFLLQSMLESRREPCTEFTLPYGKSEIAHYLGLTPETFSRCLKLLAQADVGATGHTIQLRNKQALCGYCDPYTAVAQKCKRYCEAGFCRLYDPVASRLKTPCSL